ncbi:MAG: CoA pyrophosphatase [Ignavibacteria bacterium]|nr:CoA pyrophosphatase [Ignavibacteria bacterium]
MMVQLELFLSKFQEALTEKKLKGKISHEKMSPLLDERPYRPFEATHDASQSAVLVLLVGESFEQLKILFTLRSSRLPKHKNQISFPGGHSESDESPIETALRETEEELGVKFDKIRILGILSNLFVPPSNTVVVPVVGYLPLLPKLKLNKDEVTEVLLHPLQFFLDKRNIRVETWLHEEKKIQVPLWKIHYKIPLWGATAMILSECIDICLDILCEIN